MGFTLKTDIQDIRRRISEILPEKEKNVKRWIEIPRHIEFNNMDFLVFQVLEKSNTNRLGRKINVVYDVDADEIIPDADPKCQSIISLWESVK